MTGVRLLRSLPLVLLSAACATGAGVPVGSSSSTNGNPTTTLATSSTTTTGPATTTTTRPPSTVTTVGLQTRCERIAPPVQVGTVADPGLSEISGIALSRAFDGVIWAHNDSGGDPVVVALDRSGATLGEVTLQGGARDWEDIAIGPGPGTDHIYVADIGDNDSVRESVEILRFPEPDPAESGTVDPQRLRVTYPGGPADAEALVADPSGDVFILTKVVLGQARLLRIPASSWVDSETVAETVGSVDVGLLGIVTGADASPDGTLVAVRTYFDVYLFSGDTVADALAGPRCAAPAPSERQGEAIALTPTGYLTIGEGANQPVWEAASG